MNSFLSNAHISTSMNLIFSLTHSIVTIVQDDAYMGWVQDALEVPDSTGSSGDNSGGSCSGSSSGSSGGSGGSGGGTGSSSSGGSVSMSKAALTNTILQKLTGTF